MVRLSLLMQGIPMPHLRTPDEFDADRFGHQYSGSYLMLQELFYDGKYDAAWVQLRGMPEEFRESPPIARYLDLLDRVDKNAHAELQRRIRENTNVNPFVRLRVALEDHDDAGALDALNAISAERQSPPVYECIRAQFLAKNGKPAAGLAIVRNVMTLEPLMTFAYLTAVRIGASSRPEDAIDVLKSWARLAQPSAIDATLARFAELSAFRESAGYREWFKASAVKESQAKAG
jgi:hypothetical protein